MQNQPSKNSTRKNLYNQKSLKKKEEKMLLEHLGMNCLDQSEKWNKILYF